MKVLMKSGIAALLFVFLITGMAAGQTERPEIMGIAKMTFLVSDFETARDYYGRFLGFDEAFTYESGLGKVISFKVNDRQFIEFIQDPLTREKVRLVSLSLETQDVNKMHDFLRASGWEVPLAIGQDGAGNRGFTVKDYSGIPIEFIQYSEIGLHRKSKGLFLSEDRISKRIHHAGLYTSDIRDEDPFYSAILNLTPILRYPVDKSLKPVMIYFGIPESTESIEHYASTDVNISHPCFLVEDMQEALYMLKERNGGQLPGKPMIGKGKRWILNLNNPDGTRVEFTEAFTAVP